MNIHRAVHWGWIILLLSNSVIALSIAGILLANSQAVLFLCVGIMAVFYGPVHRETG